MTNTIKFLIAICCLSCIAQVANAQDIADRDNPSTWQVTPANYENSMIITAVIDIEGEESADPDDLVAAFEGTTNFIRGVSSPAYVPALDRYFVSLFVYSNGTGEEITFRVYDASTDVSLPCTTTYTFEANKAYGSFAFPDTITTIRIEANFSKDDVLCAADNNGFAKANVTGGNPPYGYEWSTGATTDSIGGLNAGRYFLTITDGNGFNKRDSVDILNLNRPIIAPTLVAAPTDTVCEGQDVYFFAFSPETESPSYLWYDNFGNFVQEDDALFVPDIAASQEYEVFTDVRNCLSPPTEIEVAVQAVPSSGFSISNTEPTPNDTIVFNADANAADVTFFWDFGDGNTSTAETPNHAYSSAGNYQTTLSITTPEGCTLSSSEFISVDERAIDVLLDINQPACDNAPSGSISAQAINGVAPYSFLWSTGDTTAQITGLLPGDYGLTVTDAQGNVRESSISLEASADFAPPQVAINSGGPVCQGEDILLSAFSQEEDVDFYWYNDAQGTALLGVGQQLQLYNLSSRSIWVQGVKGGCTTDLAEVELQTAILDASFSVSESAVVLGQATVFTIDNIDPALTYNWGLGDGTVVETTQPLSHTYNLAGTYEATLTVSSADGCTFSQSRFVNVWGGALQLTPQTQPADCEGDASGAASLTIQNGQAPYTYQWSTGSQQAAINGLLPGGYGVTVTDANGLTASAQFTVGSTAPAPDAPTLIINSGNTLCAGDDTYINAFSGTEGAVFYWYDSPDSNTPFHVGPTLFLFDVQFSTEYYVEARAGSCTSARAVADINVSAPDANFITSAEAVFTGQEIDFTVISPASGTLYRWDWGDNEPDGQGAETVHTYSLPGIYEVSLSAFRTNTGCTDTKTTRIQVLLPSDTGGGGGGGGNDAPLSALPLSEPARCAGSSTGQLNAVAFGGQPPYNFEWSNGSTAALQTNVTPGNYFLTVTDAAGNTAVGNTQVSVLTDINTPSAIVNGGQPACAGEAIWLAATSTGDAASQFSWYAEADGTEPLYIGQSVQLNGLITTDTLYLEAVTAGCQSDRVEVPIEVDGAYAQFSLDNPAPAVGGDVSFFADSLSANFNYAWSFGDGNEASGPAATHAYSEAGLYEAVLEVETDNGCTARQRRFVNVFGPASGNGTFAVALSLQHPHCPEDETGAVNPLVFGGQPPYSYAWSTGATTGSLLNVGVGSYSLTVTDAAGQEAISSASLQSLQPNIPAPEAGLAGGGVACAGGSTWLAATGGEPGTQFIWYDAPTGGNEVFTGSYLEMNNLQSPLALFVEAQYEGCVSASRTPVFVDIESADAGFTANPAVAPVGTAVGVAASAPAGQSFNWDFGDGNGATGATASHTFAAEGIYSVQLAATTGSGCEDVQTRLVRVLPGQELQMQAAVQPASCADEADGSLSLTVEGGQPPYSINWPDGNTSFGRSSLLPGDYSLTVSDNAGQVVEETITLPSSVPALSIDQAGISGGQAPCPREPLTLAAIGSVTDAQILWYDEDTGGNLLYAGPSFPMTAPASPDTVYAEARLDGCASPSRAAVDVNPQAPDASFSFSPANPLPGEPITFEATTTAPEAVYAWDFGDGSTSSVAAPAYTYDNDGVYEASLTVTLDGCSFTETRLLTVGFGQALGVVLEPTPTQCDGDANGAVAAQAVNGTPPYDFSWSNGETGPFVQGLPQGSYVATVTDADGDTATAETQITSLTPALPVPQAASNNNLLCPDEVLVLYAFDNTGATSNFFWYDSPQGGSLLGAGNAYSQQGIGGDSQTFYVEAAAGACRSNERRAITVLAEQPNQGFTASASTVVAGNTLSFAPVLADSSYSYEWSFGNGAVSTQMMPAYTYDTPGQYTVGLTVTSDNGCVQTIQEPAFVQVVPEGALTVLLNVSQPACEEDTTGAISVEVLNGLPPYSFEWSNGQTSAGVTGLAAGQYGLTVTDNDGNSVTRDIQLAPLFAAPAQPTVSPGADTPLCLGQGRVLTASSGQAVDQYYWYSDGELLGSGFSLAVEPEEAGSLPLEVQAQRGSCFSESANLLYEVEASDASFEANTAPALELTAFTPANQGYASYYWDFGDGSTSTLMQPSHLYAAPGQYTVTLEVESQAGCRASLAQTITVEEDAGLQVELEKEDVLCPEGDSGRILARASGGEPPYNFLWSDGSTTPEITGLSLGNYSVTVTDSGGDGAEASMEIVSLDEELPAPAVTANGGAAVCKNEPAYLAGTVPGYPSASINWYEAAGGATPLQTGSVLILPGLEEDTGLYAESLYAGCRSGRVPVPVEVQAPEVGFSIDPGRELEAGGLVQFIPDNPQPGHSYYWTFGDNGWSMQTAPFYFYNMEGAYDASLEVTDEDGCSNRLVKEGWIEVQPFAGLQEDEEDEAEIRGGQLAGSRHIEGQAFPNPFAEELTVVLKVAKAGRYRMSLTDAYGREVWGTEATLDTRTYNWGLNLAKQQLGPGLYLLRIAGEGEQAVLKLVKNSR